MVSWGCKNNETRRRWIRTTGTLIPLGFEPSVHPRKTCRVRGSNSRPSDYETDALPTEPTQLQQGGNSVGCPGIEPGSTAWKGSRPSDYETDALPTEPTQQGGKSVRCPGIEPGSTAWKAAMLTITPATQG